MEKYSWFKNHEDELSYTVIHIENDKETFIATTDSEEKAKFICKACNQEDEDFEENEFEMCSRCDGHPACEDFGCAYKHGLGHLVRTEPGSDDW